MRPHLVYQGVQFLNINEFVFRFNEGNVERDTQDRLDDMFRAMVGKIITYQELVS